MGKQVFYLASVALSRILGSTEIKWGIDFKWDTVGYCKNTLGNG